ncbi:MAG: uracil-DNA glycosylase family protein [Roseomonas mucosa]|uniref:uracil-DNA glycosylase family protein n=1 Tax=Roseomonas mucosa TaxID=207340 RepID=UPI001EF5D541|nr:uracil-DNA glycosylase family protein [Roseomonas mucosa]MCG7354529.1 uracil-DNA glycosylase family protein [Roseomonas mucosa]MDU7523253.1 uracil-DNA glycosylase family protein [Roseomonas mucosa]
MYLDRIAELLRDISGRPGAVLVSGADTLVPGPLYVMGFNPGGSAEGDGSASSITIRASIKQARGQEPRNEWLDEPYGRGGFSELQNRIRSVFDELHADSKKTLCTNAIFVKSNEAGALESPWKLWWKHCWPVHQLLLHAVRPAVVVCLGNGEALSAQALLRHPRPAQGRRYDVHWKPSDADQSADGQWEEKVIFDLGEYGQHPCAVLGLPHPSPRVSKGWPLTARAREKIAQARDRMQGWQA